MKVRIFVSLSNAIPSQGSIRASLVIICQHNNHSSGTPLAVKPLQQQGECTPVYSSTLLDAAARRDGQHMSPIVLLKPPACALADAQVQSLPSFSQSECDHEARCNSLSLLCQDIYLCTSYW